MVLLKNELELIRNGFSINHMYSVREDMDMSKPHVAKMEIGHYDVACSILVSECHEHVKSVAPHNGYGWLVSVIFNKGKSALFITAKDAHVHVMVALDTLVNVAPA